MNQKGFIQIPILVAIIIATVGLASMGAGVVLYKQGKLIPFIANISEVFEGTKETAITEEIKPEESQIEQLGAIQEEIAQQELEKAKLDIEKENQEVEEVKSDAEKDISETEKSKSGVGSILEHESQSQAEEVKEEKPSPSIVSVTPNEISINSDNLLTIKVANFSNLSKDTIEVIVNNKNIEISIVLVDGIIRAMVYSNTLELGVYDIQVKNIVGEMAILLNALTVIRLPNINDDTSPPVIYETRIDTIQYEDCVTVKWDTSEPSTSQVIYGEGSSLDKLSLLDNSLIENHSIYICGLKLDTKYSFEVISKDGAGNQTISSTHIFYGQSSTLTVSTDISSPGTSYVPIDSSYQTVGIWRFTNNTNGEIVITQIGFSNTNLSGSKNVSALELFKNGVQQGGQTEGSINNEIIFYPPKIVISSKSYQLIELRADFRQATTEDQVAFKLLRDKITTEENILINTIGSLIANPVYPVLPD